MSRQNDPQIEAPHAVALGDAANPAQGRPRCRVALDLRVPGVVGAVAVGRNGTLRGWALVGGGLEPSQLIHLALDRLAVRPRQIRVLLGSRLAHVAPVSAVGAPSVDDVRETLEQEGYSPGTGALAHGAVHCGGASWLAAACADDEVAAICRALETHTAIGPTFVVDQLFLAANLEPGSAAVEKTRSGFTVIALGADGAPLSRFLSPGVEANLPNEIRRLLSFAGLDRAAVEFLGEDRATGAAAFDGDEKVAYARPLPGSDQNQLPERLELAWRVALDTAPPELASPFQKDVRSGLAWASRVSAIGMLLALGGVAVAFFGYRELLSQDARLDQVRRRHAGVEERLEQLGELGGIARSAAAIAKAIEPQSPRWPALRTSIDTLAWSRPERVGWERLTIEDGALELVVSAAGPDPAKELDEMRRGLQACPGLANVSHTESVADPKGLGTTQTFRGQYVQGEGAAR